MTSCWQGPSPPDTLQEAAQLWRSFSSATTHGLNHWAEIKVEEAGMEPADSFLSVMVDYCSLSLFLSGNVKLQFSPLSVKFDKFDSV